MAEIDIDPKWHPIHFKLGEPSCGDILCSFCIVEHEYNFAVPVRRVQLNSRVSFKEFDVSMLILGMRKLQSPGILPVKKAFAKFNVKSLVPPGGPDTPNIKT